ncbi:G-type lectin S-receptor-like serine/threonine-protein kinase LECRK1, partial [Mucuna pruriens]
MEVATDILASELNVIGRICHKNLVGLIGFCDEEIHRLLVYELMSNDPIWTIQIQLECKDWICFGDCKRVGVLTRRILFGQSKPNWKVRIGFALGIARGLVYLHEECDTPIIHYDIKPQNILR